MDATTVTTRRAAPADSGTRHGLGAGAPTRLRLAAVALTTLVYLTGITPGAGRVIDGAANCRFVRGSSVSIIPATLLLQCI